MPSTTKPFEVVEYARNRGARGVNFTVPEKAIVEPCNDGTGDAFLIHPMNCVPPFYRFDATFYGVRIPAEFWE